MACYRFLDKLEIYTCNLLVEVSSFHARRGNINFKSNIRQNTYHFSHSFHQDPRPFQNKYININMIINMGDMDDTCI